MLQMPLYAPQRATWKLPDMNSLPRWGRAKRVGYDVETKDPNLRKKGKGPGIFRKDGHICGFGLTIEHGRSIYLPIRHEGGGNLPEDAVLRYMRDNAAEFEGDIVGANLSYDLGWSRNDKIEFSRKVMFRDVQIAEPLINELPDRMDLAAIAERRGVPGKVEKFLIEESRRWGLAGKNDDDVKANLHKLPGTSVGQYCEGDTEAPLAILRRQEAEIERLGLQAIWRLESQLLPVLDRVRARGIRVDLRALEEIEEWSRQQEREAIREIEHLCGYKLVIGQCQDKHAVAPLLKMRNVQLSVNKILKDGRTDYEITKELLQAHSADPVVAKLFWARKVNLLRTKFAVQTRSALVGDRIHCTLKQIAMQLPEDGKGEKGEKGARYGRMSAVNPPLQQQPSQDEFAEAWRGIYIPEEFGEWGCLDYSQQEPRWATHFAAQARIREGYKIKGKPVYGGKLTGAEEAAQAYWDDPNIDNHSFMAETVYGTSEGKYRKYAKAIYLGLCYGKGGASLCKELGLKTAWRVRFHEARISKTFATKEEAMAAKAMYQGEATYRECAGAEGQSVMDKFHARAPFIGQLSGLCSQMVASRGWIRTVGGRVLNFPLDRDGKYDWQHKGLNRLAQGSAADQMKQAMVDVDREMPNTWINLQVHDEVDGTFRTRAEALQAAGLLRNAIKNTRVPFRVDVEMGKNWGTMELVAA